jgi:hypothetical protein
VKASDLAGELAKIPHALAKEIHRQTHRAVRSSAEANTPVGAGKDKHPGLLKRSWEDVPGSIESAVEQLQPTKVKNVAPHAGVVAPGRRRTKAPYRARKPGKKGVGRGRKAKDSTSYYLVKAGKMLGSEQAPFGIKREVYRDLDGQRDSILTSAIAKVEGG